jgi:hypothetical protein
VKSRPCLKAVVRNIISAVQEWRKVARGKRSLKDKVTGLNDMLKEE